MIFIAKLSKTALNERITSQRRSNAKNMYALVVYLDSRCGT